MYLVLLFVFWYCYKRGRETRLEREKTEESDGRIAEVADDPMLEEAGPSRSTTRSRRSHDNRERGTASDHDYMVATDQHSSLRPDNRPSSSRRKSSERRAVGAGTPERT